MTDEQLFNHAITLQQEGRPQEALDTLLGLCHRQPDNGYIWGTLGLILDSLGRMEESVAALQKGVELDPQTEIWRQKLGYLFIQRGRFSEIAKLYEGSEIGSVLMRATYLDSIGEYRKVVQILSGAISAPPPSVYDGRAIPVEAHLAKAKLLYAQCSRRCGNALDALSMLGRPNVLATTPPAIVNDAASLGFEGLFERGRCYDVLGHYGAAWDCFVAANRVQNIPFNAEELEGRVRRAQNAPRTHQGTREGSNLIFIVGIPRSGTSLLEQILSCHPQITAMGERPEIGYISHILDGEGWPDLSPSQIDHFADQYLEGCPDQGFLTDKMPDNWCYQGLIKQMFPKAQIVHCIRDPHDCLASCFMQSFASNSLGWATTVEGLRTYYHLWQGAAISGGVHYEELVRGPEAVVGPLLKDLGLPFDERCLRPEESLRHVNTASYAQVKEPIHSRSIGRGDPYQRHILL